MKQFLAVVVLAVVASVCGAQDCLSSVDRSAQMKEAIAASKGTGVYFEVNGCVWKPGKNPRDKKTVKPALPQPKTNTVEGSIEFPPVIHSYPYPTVSWRDEVDSAGHYRAIFEDTGNAWRCVVASTTDGFSYDQGAITITCFHPHEVPKAVKK